MVVTHIITMMFSSVFDPYSMQTGESGNIALICAFSHVDCRGEDGSAISVLSVCRHRVSHSSTLQIIPPLEPTLS